MGSIPISSSYKSLHPISSPAETRQGSSCFVILLLRKWRQEDRKFKVIPVLDGLASRRLHSGRPARVAGGGLRYRPAESTWRAREEGVSEMNAPSGPPHTPGASNRDEQRALLS